METTNKAWSSEKLEQVYIKAQEDYPDDVANLIAPEVKKPLHQNAILRAVVVFGGAGLLAMAGYGLINAKSKPVAQVESASPTVLDPEANEEGWKAAGGAMTAGGLAVDVPTDKPFVKATTPQVSPSPKVTPIATKAPQVKPTVPVVATPKTQIIYRTLPAPRVVASVAKPSTPAAMPVSFIPIRGGRATQQKERKVQPVTAPVQRTPRAVLDSERYLMQGGATTPADPLIAGSRVAGRLSSPFQSMTTTQSTTPMRVSLTRPMFTNKGYSLPAGTTVAFLATVGQSGAITAESGDAEYRGRPIFLPKGAISIQAANGQPLVASSFRPRMGELASADRNNALWGAAGEVGNVLTQGSASIRIGDGSTIVQQTNQPNIVGAVLKGGFGSVSTDQRARTQAEATQIMSAPPVQYLPPDTPVVLIVNSPAMVKIPR